MNTAPQAFQSKAPSKWNTSIQKVALYPQLIIQAPSLVKRQVSWAVFCHANLRVSLQRCLSPQKAVGHHPWNVEWEAKNISFFLKHSATGICMIILRSMPTSTIEDRANCRQGYYQKLISVGQRPPVHSEASLIKSWRRQELAFNQRWSCSSHLWERSQYSHLNFIESDLLNLL